jgi:hypothetical protein
MMEKCQGCLVEDGYESANLSLRRLALQRLGRDAYPSARGSCRFPDAM